MTPFWTSTLLRLASFSLQGTDDPPVEVANADCGQNDVWEPNDTPEQAAVIPPEGGQTSLEAFLCPGEDDWYRISAKGIGFPPFSIQLDLYITESSFCAGICSPALPDAPENAVSVELYNAKNGKLLGENVVLNGRLDLDVPLHAKDLLIHVFGPPEATYGYVLQVWLQAKNKTGGEDECEC